MGEYLYGMHCNHEAYAGHCPYCHMDLPSIADRKLEIDLRRIAEEQHAKVKRAIHRHKKIKVRRNPA